MNYKKIFLLLGALIFVLSVSANIFIPAAKAAGTVTTFTTGAGIPIGRVDNVYGIEICVKVTNGNTTTAVTNATVSATQGSTAIQNFKYTDNSDCHGYLSPNITGTSGTPNAPGTGCVQSGGSAKDHINIKATSSDGKSSAAGYINLCTDETGRLYATNTSDNNTDSLQLVAGQSTITVIFNVSYDGKALELSAVPSPIVNETLSNSSATYTLSLANVGNNNYSSATLSNVIIPGTYTLAILYEYGGQGYAVPTNQATYTFSDTTPSSVTEPTVTLASESGGVVTTPPTTTSNADCTTNPDAAGCQGQVVVCNATFFNPVSWFVCPIVSSIQDIMNSIGSAITSYLTIPITYFDASSTTGKPLYEAWNSVRDIALSLLAIVALVMIFSQALSMGPFDAYTVKKVLPRLIIAAILITLSWPLIGLLIGLSNGIGNGIRYLIYAPFRTLPPVNFTIGGESLVAGLGVGSALGLFGTLTLGIMAALALFTGLIIIVIRQIVVVLLAILAPVALVLYILPGTEKAWKLWWNSFWGALIMFPLIEAFIAAGSVFSKIAEAAGNTGLLDKIIAYIAIYLPYFLLPLTIRLSGGMMQAIGGRIAQTSSGIQSGLSKRRKMVAARNRQDIREGQRFSERNWASKHLNRAITGVAAGPRGWTPTARGRAVRNQNIAAGIARAQRENPAFQAFGKDPFTLRWNAMYGSVGEAKAAANKTRDSKVQKVQSDHAERIRKAQEDHTARIRKAQAEHNARVAGGMSLAESNRQFQQDTINSAAIMQQERVNSATTMQKETDIVNNELRSSLGQIAQAQQIGWNQPDRQLAFTTAMQMGGKGFDTPKQIQDAAHSIAGHNQILYESMMGAADHDLKAAGSTHLITGSPGQQAEKPWQQERDNFNSVDLRTQFNSGDAMKHWSTYAAKELLDNADRTDPEGVERRETALQMIVEMDNARNFGIGTGNLVVNEQLNDKNVKFAREKAYIELGKKIRPDLVPPPERILSDEEKETVRKQLMAVGAKRMDELARKPIRPEYYETES